MAVNRVKLLKSAQAYLQKNKFDKALEDYTKLLEDDPRDSRTLLKIAEIKLKLNDVAGACRVFGQVAAHYTEDGFFLKAVAVYKQIQKLAPTNADISQKLAALYGQLGLVTDAVAQYKRVIQSLIERGDTAGGLENARKILQLDPDNTANRLHYFELLDMNGERKLAIDELEQLIASLKRGGKIRDLAKVYEKLLELDPQRLELCLELAKIYLKLEQPKLALVKLQVAYNQRKEHPKTLQLLAQAFVDLGQPDKAKAVFLELIKIFTKQGNAEEKEKIYRKIMELNLDDQGFSKSFAMFKENHHPEPEETEISTVAASQSIDTTQQAEIDIAKKLSEADVYIKYGLFDKALSHLKTVTTYEPDNLQAHHRLKELFLKKNDVPSAINQLFLIMNIVENQNKREGVVAVLQEILQLDLNNYRAKQILNAISSVTQRKQKDKDSGSTPGADISAINRGIPLADERRQEQPPETKPLTIAPPNGQPGSIQDLGFDDEFGAVETEFGDVSEADIPLIDDEIAFDQTPPSPSKSPEVIEEEFSFDDEPIFDVETVPAPQAEENAHSGSDEFGEFSDTESPDELDDAFDEEPTAPPPLFASAGEAEPGDFPEPFDEVEIATDDTTLEGLADVPADIAPIPEGSASLDDLPLPVREDLAEVDFFISHGMVQEALEICVELQAAGIKHAYLDQKFAYLERQRDITPDHFSQPSFREDKIGDDGETSGAKAKDGSEAAREPTRDFGQVLEEFKQGIQETIKEGDSQTHYELAVAYREMGIWDDAIAEFLLASRDPRIKIKALQALGLCYIEANQPKKAVETLVSLLDSGSVPEDRKIEIFYDLGNAYHALKNRDVAYKCFQKVYANNPAYKNVASKLKELKEAPHA